MNGSYYGKTQIKEHRVSFTMGLDKRPDSADGTLYNMKNCSGDSFPLISPREKRVRLKTLSSPGGLGAAGKLAWVDGNTLYYGGDAVKGLSLTEGRKQLVPFGSKLLIFPDGKYYDTVSGEYGSLSASFTTAPGMRANFTLCSSSGTDYNVTVSSQEPESPVNGACFIDNSGESAVMKVFSSSSGLWRTADESYVKISYSGIGVPFSAGDSVKVSGCVASGLNGTFVIKARENNYIILSGALSGAFFQTASLTVDRGVPLMDFITVSENRVWGCRYGADRNGNFVNAVYSSKAGDPFNWNCFEGGDDDSFFSGIGSSGEFTGAASHLGYVLFFKENIIHRVRGNKPASFKIGEIYCRGVQKGSERSVCVCNGTLFYKASDAVCRFDGGLPEKISSPLGNQYYKNAVAASIGDKYYIKMDNPSGEHGLFIWDDEKRLWYKEDDPDITDFAYNDGFLYYIDGTQKTLVLENGDNITDEIIAEFPCAETEGKVEWMAETGDMGIDDACAQYITKLKIRLSVGAGSVLYIRYMCDSSGDWADAGVITSCKNTVKSVLVSFPRCDSFRLMFSGKGDASIYGVSYLSEKGGEVR